MHGMTETEIRQFKRIKQMAHAAKSIADIMEVKKATWDWICKAKSAMSRQRRKNMSQAIKFAYSTVDDVQEHKVEGTLAHFNRYVAGDR